MNHGVQKVEPPESHWLLADRVEGVPNQEMLMPWLAQKSFTFPNPNPQNANGVQPSAFGGFGTHAPGKT